MLISARGSADNLHMEHWYLYLLPGVLGVIFLAVRLGTTIPGLWQSSSQFNSTSGWTPASPHDQVRLPQMTTGLERGPRIITPRLEAGETLEGFAFGFFSPPRPQDWAPSRIRLLIGVTPRRIMLFEHTTTPWALLSYCSIRYDAIRYLQPPKECVFGTSGRLRFGLHSGLEYQIGFLGPVIYPEFLEQEQRMAAYLRSLAPRFPSSPKDTQPHRRAA